MVEMQAVGESLDRDGSASSGQSIVDTVNPLPVLKGGRWFRSVLSHVRLLMYSHEYFVRTLKRFRQQFRQRLRLTLLTLALFDQLQFDDRR